MILLTTTEKGADELIFVNPQHIVTVRFTEDGKGTRVQLLNGGAVTVLEDRDELVGEIESALGVKRWA